MGVFSTFLFILLLSLLLLHPLSADYSPPDRFFVNCGSNSSVEVDNRTFVGDETPGSSFSFSGGMYSTVTTTNSSLQNSLYQTARVFRRSSRYEFTVDETGVYFVRLHFFNNNNLGDALFDVSASNFSLLSRFPGQSSSDSSNFPAIEEFLIVVEESIFAVEFTPSNRNSIAFVNAIEVFLAPNDTVADKITAINSSTKTNYSYSGVRSQVLHTVHRINVGGQQQTDNLWRNWDEYSDYSISETSKICAPYSGTLNYNVLGSTNFNAPEFVYNTCRESTAITGVESSFSNITWRLNVRKNTRHLVRAHFCDIISKKPGDIHFNLSISSTYSMLIDPYGVGELYKIDVKVATPFYYDLVADSDDSGFIDISVVPRIDSLDKTAYLNGLEIMEFVERVDLGSGSSYHEKSKMFLFVVIGSAILLAFILAVVLGLVFKYRKAKQQRYPPISFVGGLTPLSPLNSKTANSILFPRVNLNLKISLAEIQSATNKFDGKLLIGEGGFGKVYRGTLKGVAVAVKRSDPNHGQGISEFEAEVLLLSKIRHRNLVFLIGYCNEGSEMILVYEFMEKGNLRDHLYSHGAQKSSSEPNLAWKERLEICLGSARGLDYLHNGSAESHVHRDVKSTNILLGSNYVAKVSDFGVSRQADHKNEQFTAELKGSFGYMDPEYYKTGQFTTKSDVYSFGVVLLEVLCARPAIVDSPTKEERNLAEWGMQWKKKGQLEKIMDPVLIGTVRPDSLRKFSDVLEKCLSHRGVERPAMKDVAWDLEYALQLQIANTNPTVQDDSWTDVMSGYSSLGVNDIPSWSKGMTSEQVHNETDSFSIPPHGRQRG